MRVSNLWRWSLVAALGCSAPSYSQGEDAAVDASASLREDAGPLDDASSPTDASADAREDTREDAGERGGTIDPRGRYALLQRFYGADALGGSSWFVEEHVSLAEIDGDAGSWTLRYQNCRAHLQVFGPVPVTGELITPERAPSRTLSLLSDDGVHFRSQGEPSAMGYEAVPSCTPGARLPKPDRKWLPAGTCACPTVNENAPPARTDDCRVIDSDGDGHPGATVRYSSGNDSYMAIRDRSQLTEGSFDPRGRHRANLLRLADVSTMQCVAGPCVPSSVTTCSSSQNPVRFEPLPDMAPDGGPWTCGALATYLSAHPFEIDDPTKPDC